MKLKEILKHFCSNKSFASTICITVDNEEIIFNEGDSIEDFLTCNDLKDKTVEHCYVSESVLFIEVKQQNKKTKPFGIEE